MIQRDEVCVEGNARVRIERYASVAEVPLAIWERFASRKGVGLEAGHLRAVEGSRINDHRPYYLVGYAGAEAVGIAYGIAIDADLSRLVRDHPAEALAAVRTWRPGFLRMRLLEVGHLASLGSTIEVSPGHEPGFLRALAGELDELARLEGAELGLIRDQPLGRSGELRVLEEHGYRQVLGFPIARMPIRWESLDEYLAALRHKKRNELRRKQAKLAAPGLSVEVIEDYAPHAERLAELWTNVARREHDYEQEHLSPAWFAAMSRQLQGRSHVVAIRKDRLIIAFGLSLIGDEEYFGVAEGLDDAHRDAHELYGNVVLESLRVACLLRKRTLNLGITAYDFKASLGAELEPCVYLLKDFRDPERSAAWAALARQGIPQPEARHRPFRERETAPPPPRRAAAALDDSGDRRDPFRRHARYVRADVARAVGLYPFCPPFESAQEPVMEHRGRPVIMLGTNSYLGLANHPEVKEAARAALGRYGTGCSGSPMYNGTLELHQRLARELATFVRKDDALVFSTGYQTNVGAISALVGRDDVILMDERNHGSLVDGARLSRARLVRYRHADVASLGAALARHREAAKLVVTDSLFSMEGTIVDLPAMVRLVKEHHARLMLDESHALGVIGPTGRGVAEHFRLMDEVDVIMGTFSKSFASIGGFVAGAQKLIDTLRHTARAHILSASLPPASVAAVLAALRIVDADPERRTRLRANAGLLAEGLRVLGYEVGSRGGAIVPVHCGDELLALAAYHELLQHGVFVNPVTYPAVPRGQELLRLSVMATHDERVLSRALSIFARVRTPTWPRRAESDQAEPCRAAGGHR